MYTFHPEKAIVLESRQFGRQALSLLESSCAKSEDSLAHMCEFQTVQIFVVADILRLGPSPLR
jgi:hypothetical protein